MSGKIIQHKNKFAGVPAPVEKIAELTLTVTALQDIVETLVRQKGSINQSAVTVSDLIELGIINNKLYRAVDLSSK